MTKRKQRLPRIPALILYTAMALALLVGCLQLIGRDDPMREPDFIADPKPEPIVLAFVGEALEQGLSAIADEMANSVDVVSPHWIRFNASGVLLTKHGSSIFIAAAHDAHMQVWPLVSYAGPYGSKAGCPAVLCNAEVREEFVDELMHWVVTLNVDGLVLDVENVLAEAKTDLVHLTKQLTAAMHSQNRQLWLAVFPQVEFSPTLRNFHDVAALGAIADGVILMTYDQHSPNTGPGPIAAHDWVLRNVEDIVQQVPPHRVILGLAGYGYRWTRQGNTWRTSVVATQDMEQLALEQKQQVTDTSQVWWESTTDAVSKAALVQQYGLRGVAVWRQGLASPQLWPALQEALGINKHR